MNTALDERKQIQERRPTCSKNNLGLQNVQVKKKPWRNVCGTRLHTVRVGTDVAQDASRRQDTKRQCRLKQVKGATTLRTHQRHSLSQSVNPYLTTHYRTAVVHTCINKNDKMMLICRHKKTPYVNYRGYTPAIVVHWSRRHTKLSFTGTALVVTYL